MKKLLLSGLTFLALATAANAQGISDKAIFDDFKDADSSTVGTVEQYAWLTEETKWEDTLNKGQGGPVAGEFASKGSFWTEADGKNDNHFFATKSRTGNGKLGYVLSQDTGKYGPFLVVFGAYAKNGTKKEFTLDLSQNANISFSFTNKGTETIRLTLQVLDSAGAGLLFDKAAADDLDAVYNYNIGFGQKPGSASDPVGPGQTVTFNYDLKDAIIGDGGKSEVYPDSVFDYSKVKSVLFTVINDKVVSSKTGDYRPIALKNYAVEFSNFKLGDVSTIVTGLENNTLFVNAADEVVTVFDMVGTELAKGKVRDLNLEAGKLYIFKSATGATRKVVIK